MSKTSLAAAYNLPAPPPAIFDRDALVEAHLPLVKFVAERIAARLPHNVDREDLIGAGLIGLIEAADKYDPSRGVQFKSYAEWRVRGAIFDSLRDLDTAPRSARQRAREVQAAYSKIEQEQGRPATEEEVAEALGMSLLEFQSVLSDLRWLTVARLDDETEDGSGSLADRVQADPELIPSAIYERTEQREILAAAVDLLPPRERQVVALYYVEELTMKEIGAVLGVTESRVCQIHTQAVLHLRIALATRASGTLH